MHAIDLREMDLPGPLVHILAAMDDPRATRLVFLLPQEPYPLYPLIALSRWRHAGRAVDGGWELTLTRHSPLP